MRRPGIEPGPALWVIDYRLGHYPRPHRRLITMWEIPIKVHHKLHYMKSCVLSIYSLCVITLSILYYLFSFACCFALYTISVTNIVFAARTAPATVLCAPNALARSPKALQTADVIPSFPLACGFCGAAPCPF